MNIREICYQLYIMDWKLINGITPKIESEYFLDYCETELDYSTEVEKTFEEYIYETGYGILYVCFNEFLDNEYQDEEYILSLLDDNKNLIEKYLADKRSE